MNIQDTAIAESNDRRALDEALTALQATASQFGASAINDAQVRAQYARDIAASANEFREAVNSGQISAREAAERASATRNQIMELARRRSSPVVRAYATRMKQAGRSLSDLAEKYAQRFFGDSFSTLSQERQSGVYVEIIRAAGRPDPAMMRLAEKLGRAGRRVLLVSLAVAVYEVAESDNKPREIARQAALAGVGAVGSWAVGSAAVAAGVCTATAPVCVTVVAFAGGLLAVYGADAGLGALYPRPSR